MLAFYLLLTTEVKCLRICKRGTMNELPVIGSLRLRTDFWDRHVADIVIRYKGTYGERFIWTSKNAILVRDYGFFAAVLSYMVKDNVVTLEVKVFAGINTEYVIKNTENFSPYVRSIVKSSSCNGLKVLQNYPEISTK